MITLKAFLGCGAAPSSPSKEKKYWNSVYSDEEDGGRNEDALVLPTNRPYVAGDERVLCRDAQQVLGHLFPDATSPLEALRQAKTIGHTNCFPQSLRELVAVCENLEHFDFKSHSNGWTYAAFLVAKNSPKLRDIKVYLHNDHDVQRLSNAFGPVLPNLRSLSVGSRQVDMYHNKEPTFNPQTLATLIGRMPHLRYLDVAGHPLKDAQLRALVKNSCLKGLVVKSTQISGDCLSHPALRQLQYLDISDLDAAKALRHVKKLKNLTYLVAGSSDWPMESETSAAYSAWCKAQGILLMGGFNPAATLHLVNQLWADAARSDGSIPVESLADLKNFRERIGGFLKYVDFPLKRFGGQDPLEDAQALVDYAITEVESINRVRVDNRMVSCKLHYGRSCSLSLTDRSGGTYSIEINDSHLHKARSVKPLSAALQASMAPSTQMVWSPASH